MPPGSRCCHSMISLPDSWSLLLQRNPKSASSLSCVNIISQIFQIINVIIHLPKDGLHLMMPHPAQRLLAWHANKGYDDRPTEVSIMVDNTSVLKKSSIEGLGTCRACGGALCGWGNSVMVWWALVIYSKALLWVVLEVWHFRWDCRCSTLSLQTVQVHLPSLVNSQLSQTLYFIVFNFLLWMSRDCGILHMMWIDCHDSSHDHGTFVLWVDVVTWYILIGWNIDEPKGKHD